MIPVELTVNGKRVAHEVADNQLLVDFLRMDLQITGTKEGCGVGVCGACTVLLDGLPVSACITLTVQANSRTITTIEGLGNGERLDAVQEAFISHGGFQCGICTPGQIMAAKALLAANPYPNRDNIQHWMMGNLCRCTGYYKIIESIEAASEAGQP